MLSYGGRIILLNSVLSSIPLYWLALFRIPQKIRLKIDKLRNFFLWYGGHAVKKKYTLVVWNVVRKSKAQGGFGSVRS
jgi:hypothetical protein